MIVRTVQATPAFVDSLRANAKKSNAHWKGDGMSIAKVKEAVDACKEDYVTLPAALLNEAFKEAKDAGELAVHVAKELLRNPAAVMSLHKDKHLGKLCGVPSLAVKS